MRKPMKSLWVPLRGRWIVICLIVFISAAARGQQAGGTLQGLVTDPSGAAVPSATVTITNTATGIQHVWNTNADGVYAAPNLIPGTYQVNVAASGFATAVLQGIGLLAGEQRQLNVTMKLGQAAETITVQGGQISERPAGLLRSPRRD